MKIKKLKKRYIELRLAGDEKESVSIRHALQSEYFKLARIMKKVATLTVLITLFFIGKTRASALYMTNARFDVSTIYGNSRYGGRKISDMVGVYNRLEGPNILVRTKSEGEVWDMQTGILTGINDTEEENIKLLTFIWRIDDGMNYKYTDYTYQGVGLENICAYVTFYDDRRCIDESNEIIEYKGQIPNEEIEEMLFVENGTKVSQKR